ncbi:MAG: BON domain-containing protein [Betaproteobacteria bacterium]|nr:BON domain-containing protein [Betaproteobacteria bacterium]
MENAMRNASFAVLIATALAACSEAEPPKPAAAAPAQPVVRAPAHAPTPPPAPAAAPQTSPDEQLAERVKKALRDSTTVEGQGVGVRVAGGAVTLYGTAPSAGERRKIEAFVAGLDGVKSVNSKLVIVQGS